jgi:hypothetical protein
VIFLALGPPALRGGVAQKHLDCGHGRPARGPLLRDGLFDIADRQENWRIALQWKAVLNTCEVDVGGERFRVEVDGGGVMTVWRRREGGDVVLGRGLVEQDGRRCRIRDSSPQLTLDVRFAIEKRLSGDV